MVNKKLINTLSYLGLVPFYVILIFYFFNKNFYLIDIFFYYSLVIITFLSGCSWVKLIETSKISLIIVTIFTPILNLVAEIFLCSYLKGVLYLIFYYLIFFIDKKYITYSPDYIFMRRNLTYLVMLSQIIMLIVIYTNNLG